MDLSFLKTALPALATALGGPFAGLAAGFIADKLGVSDKTIANVSDVLSKASQSPETMLELKRIEIDFQKYLVQIGITEAELEYKDRDSARNREIQVRDNTPKILAYSITVGFFGILGWIIIKGLPAGNEQVTIYMLGSLNTAWITIMAYYFGSTKGSADKTTVMAATLNQNPLAKEKKE